MLCLRREEELRKLRKRLANNTDGELRERDTAEAKKMIEDTAPLENMNVLNKTRLLRIDSIGKQIITIVTAFIH